MMKMKNFLMLALVTVMGVVLASCEGRDNPVRTSLDVDTSTLNLFVGESAIRTATTKAQWDYQITYTSSNPAVATVDPIGKVTAVSEGEAIITVKMGESLKSWYAAKTLTYNVVVKKYVSVTGLAINGTDALATSGYSGHLSAAVIPADATDASVTSVTWSSSAPEVLSVDANGNVTFVSDVLPLTGVDVTITATSNADNTIKGSEVISVSPLVGWFVGANGMTYSTKAAANAVTTAEAWIAYKSATAGKSLAFALTNDAPGGKSWNAFAANPGWNSTVNRAAISGGTWRWPTKTDFDNMLAGFQTLPNTGNGVTSDDYPSYWSSTEGDALSAWGLYFLGSDSGVGDGVKDDDGSNLYVRAVLAF